MGAGHEQQPPVDIEGFREEMRQAGIEAIVDSLLDLFVRDSSEAFELLTAGLRASDLDVVRSRAHLLKASSGTILASRLSAVMAEIEQAAEAVCLEEVERLHPVAEGELGRVLTCLRDRGEAGGTK
jgi:HPt (histidine-containing phosphotransfer) domain-containing protein